ncbi:hypothetical protein CSC18_1055 [Klebsiella aerogenes]|nr:hypothetical protein CSC18_1055 [Klebsiella aerogenes]
MFLYGTLIADKQEKCEPALIICPFFSAIRNGARMIFFAIVPH